MKYVIILLISIVLFSCNTIKESKKINLDTFVDSVKVVKIDTTFIIDTMSLETEPIVLANERMPNKEEGQVGNKDRKPSSVGDVEIIEEDNQIKGDKRIVDKTTKDDNPNLGLVAHSVPTSMQVGKTYTVKLRISKEKNKIQLIDGNGVSIADKRVESKITIASIRVEPIMSAKLISDSSKMIIQSTSTLVQDIEKEGFTEWEWRLTPLKGGDIFIKLMVSVIEIDSENHKITKDIPVYDDIVSVKSNIVYSTEGFISKYWQWIITTIIIPLIVWFYKKKSDEKKKNS